MAAVVEALRPRRWKIAPADRQRIKVLRVGNVKDPSSK
jgi:hypothetical protein